MSDNTDYRAVALADYDQPVYLTHGSHVLPGGEIAGVFRHVEDMLAADCDSLALAIVAWCSLTTEQQAAAEHNCSVMERKNNE